MDRLRKHVERVVRPIRASGWRKNKMREELLGHLTQKAQTKLSKGAGEEEACAFAIDQLGDPAALTQDLQATVPTFERLMFLPLPWTDIADRWFDKEHNETTFHFALLRTAYTSFALAIGLAVVLTTVGLAARAGFMPVNKSRCGPFERALIISLFFAAQALATGLAHFLADLIGVRNVLSHGNGHSAWRKTLALYLYMIGYGCLLLAFPVFVLAVQPLAPGADTGLAALYIMITGRGLRELLLCVLLLVLWAPFLGWIMKREHEQYEKWGKLEVDE
jgi:hypothetical protein